MERFNIKKVRRGAAVCTRDGRKANVLYTVRKGDYKVVALIENGDCPEKVEVFNEEGKVYATGNERDMDLMMAEEELKVKSEEGKKKLYISGRMTGLEYADYSEVFAATAEAFAEDYEVVNPARFVWCRWQWLNKLLGYNMVLCLDLWKLMKCDALYSIVGWEQSKGAKVERAVAKALGMKVM